MIDLGIRRAVPADAAVLAEFAARNFTETFAAEVRPEDLQAYLASAFEITQQSAELADPDMATLLAYEREVLVAYAQVQRKAPPACVTGESPVELHRFYVDRRVHATGVAQRLMAAVREAARGFGARHLWLSTWERNARALRFYARCGFTDAGSAVFVVGSDRQLDRILVAPVNAADP